MKKGMDKKAVNLLETVAALVLILILVFALIVIFGKGTGSWTDFFGNMFGGTSSNVETVITGCKAACGVGQYNDYCTLKRDVVFVKKGPKEQWTCADLERRIPNVGLDSCDKVSCTGEVIKCQDLTFSNCREVDPSKCTIDWIAAAAVADYQKNNLGPGKIYIAIYDLTAMVTDVAEANQYKSQGMVCVKLVKP